MDHTSVYDLPKAELHCHLDGSFRINTVFRFGKKRGVISEDMYSELARGMVCLSSKKLAREP